MTKTMNDVIKHRLTRAHYSDIAGRIDVDAFEEAIGWLPLDQDDKGNDIGQCPDVWGLHQHGDRTGKFAIHREKRVYNCWVCGGGTLLSLTMAIRDCTDEEALDWLKQFVGEDRVTDQRFVDEIDEILATKKKESHIWPWFNERTLDPWIQNLADIADWVQRRGFSAEVARYYKLGYDPAHQRTTKETYTGPAVIFPHFWEGKLVGWQERWLDEDRPSFIPKYTNTRDFPKNETLFNYDEAKLAITPIVVVESVPTSLFLQSLGIPSVATFGSSVTPTQMRLLRVFQQGVILSPDNDGAGHKFIKNLSEYLIDFINVAVTVSVPGDGSDLGDLVEEPALVREIVASADPLW